MIFVYFTSHVENNNEIYFRKQCTFKMNNVYFDTTKTYFTKQCHF